MTTQTAFIQRVQEMHDANFALRTPKDDDEQAAAWQRYRQLVLDTAREMHSQGWGSHAYYTAYDALPNRPRGNDEVVTGLEWIFFVLGYDFRADMIEED